MQSNLLFTFCLVAVASVPSILAHGVITAVEGSNGNSGTGFGFVESTPRDGTRRNPFQADTSIIRDRDIADGTSSGCGRTLGGGMINMAGSMATAESVGLPNVGPNGEVTMVFHQINGDGAGPYACDVDTTAMGTNFTPIMVATNVPGQNSRSRARTTQFPLVAQIPQGTTCTGGSDGMTCVVRCRNAANAGPFGGCVAVTQGP